MTTETKHNTCTILLVGREVDIPLKAYYKSHMLIYDERYALSILGANTAAQALKQLEAHPDIQLIVTDLSLEEEIDGLTKLIQVVRQEQFNETVDFFLLTRTSNFLDNQENHKAIKTGFHIYHIIHKMSLTLGDDKDFIINLLTIWLDNYIRSCDKQLQIKLETEHRLAQDLIDSVLIVSPPQVPGIEIASVFYQPAEDIGGDWYNISLTPQRLNILIGDVVGHGLPAGRLTPVVFGTFHGAEFDAITQGIPFSPQQILARMNYNLQKLEVDDHLTMTMFASYIDLETGIIYFSNAGHNSPILVRAESRRVKQKKLLASCNVLGDSGFPKHLNHIEQKSFALQTNDILLFFTDGLIENEGTEGDHLSEKHLVSLVRQHRAETAESLKDRIVEKYLNLCGNRPPEDDTTLVVMKITEAF